MKRSFIPLGICGAIFLSLPTPAFAYLDGATGSMLIQALIGGVAAAGMFGRHLLARMKTGIATVFRRDGARRDD